MGEVNLWAIALAPGSGIAPVCGPAATRNLFWVEERVL